MQENIAYGLSGGTTNSSWTYNLSTGFLTSQTVLGFTTTFDARADGNVDGVWDPLGHHTTFTYDWGRVSSIHTPNLVTTYAISTEGLTLSETVGTLTTTYDYDGAFRLRAVHPPATNQITFTPDDLHGTSVRVTRGASIVDHMIDAFGRETGASNSVPLHTQQYRDLCGRITFVSDPYTTGPGTQGTSVVLDALGRVKQVTDSAGKVTTYTYTGADVTRTDANNHTTSFESDIFGDPNRARLGAVTDADGHRTEYQHHVTGPLMKVTGPTTGLGMEFTNSRPSSSIHPRTSSRVWQVSCGWQYWSWNHASRLPPALTLPKCGSSQRPVRPVPRNRATRAWWTFRL